MIIAQIVDTRASEYERKSQRIDFDALRATHDVRVGDTSGAQIKHVYAPRAFAATTKRFFARREAITPFNVPEAVEEAYFDVQRSNSGSTIGSFSRPSVTPVIEQTMTRIHRFRDDVTWRIFTSPPSPQDIASVDVWVDPAVRGLHLDRTLLEAAIGWARTRGATRLQLWVTENSRTEILYKRWKFVRTGKTKPLGSDPSLRAVHMVREL